MREAGDANRTAHEAVYQHPPVRAASLIICSRNRPALLRRTVNSVIAGDSVPAEIVIIDQSDSINFDLSYRQTERGCVIRYNWVSFRGVSRARNAGIRLACYDVLAFIDDDMEVTGGWFTKLIEALEESSSDTVVTGSVLPVPSSVPGHFAISIKDDTRPHRYRGRIDDDVLYTGNMATHKATIQDVKGFDERLGPGSTFPAAEDNDLGFRFLRAGCTITYTPEAKLYHVGWRSRDDYLQIRWLYGRGQGAFYAKHLKSERKYILRRISRDILRRTARSILRLWRSPFLAAGDLVFVSGLISGVITWLITETSKAAPIAPEHVVQLQDHVDRRAATLHEPRSPIRPFRTVVPDESRTRFRTEAERGRRKGGSSFPPPRE